MGSETSIYFVFLDLNLDETDSQHSCRENEIKYVEEQLIRGPVGERTTVPYCGRG